MILAKLGEYIAIGFVATSYGVVGVEKMFTENYQPWAGDHLSSLNKVRKGTVGYVESPELLGSMCELERRRPVPFEKRTGPATTLAQEWRRDNEQFQEDIANSLDSHRRVPLDQGTKAKSIPATPPCKTASFLKIRITSGKNRKKEVWILRQDLARTVGDL